MAVYISNSVADTEALAARLAEKLRGGEVIAFARTVQAKVREKFGIEIDTEVNIL